MQPKPGQLVGIVTGDSRPDGFTFTVDPSSPPKLYDYVYVEVLDTPPGRDEPVRVKVVAQVRSIRRVAVGITPEHPWPVIQRLRLPGEDTVIAYAKVLGYKWGRSIYHPRSAPQVGSPVYIAPDELLEEFYSVEPRRRLHVGYLISRPTVRAYLDVEGIKRHVAIIAATGAGKTWTSVVLIEELLKKGATILVLDPHGEYTPIKDTIGNLGPEFEGRAVVLKGRRDQEGDILYKVSVAAMTPEELATVAGVPSKASRIRAVIAGAKMVADRLAEATLDDKWRSLKGIISIIQEAIAAVDELKASSSNSRDVKNFVVRLLRRLSSTSNSDLRSVAVEASLPAFARLWLPIRRDTEPGYDAIRYLEELDSLGVYSVEDIPLKSILKPGHVTIFNLSGLSSEVQDHLAFNILYRVFRARENYVRGLEGESYPYPIVVFLEEAHRFVPPKQSRSTKCRDIVVKIASEGRKFGVYLVAITQRPSRIDQDVLSQLQTQVILRIVNPKDQEAVRDAGEQLSQDLLSDLPGLNSGEAVVVGPMAPAPIMIRVRDRVLAYSGGDISLVEAWSEGVEELALQEDILRDAARRLSEILSQPVPIEKLHVALSQLLEMSVRRNLVEEAAKLLARAKVRGDPVTVTFDSINGIVRGEVAGYDVTVDISDGRVVCTCRRGSSGRLCVHAVAAILEALLQGLLAAPVAQEARSTSEPWSDMI